MMKSWMLVFLLGCVGSKDESDSGESVDLSDSDRDADADTDTDTDADTDTDTDADSDADSDADTDADTDADADVRFDQATFRATHNSYSGGGRGAITEQLDAGARLVELDFHDNDYSSSGFRVGHDSAGDEVDLASPNPSSLALGGWLDLLRDWSSSHPGHAPITVVLDIKDDLTDNRSTAEGSLAALNQLIDDSLGDRLYRRDAWSGSWPRLSALQDQFLVTLSGQYEGGTRKAYVRDRGREAAVAINDHGQVVEVHRSQSGDDLWYWTGQVQSDGSVEWQHHGRYDTGQQPAVALNNDGWLVEVHKSEGPDRLWYWTGYLDADAGIVWVAHDDFDDGVHPSIRFADLDGTELREIHTSQSDADQNWDWWLTLESASGGLDWGDHGRTDDALHDQATDSSAAGPVEVWSGEDGAGDEHTLLYSTSSVGSDRIRYVQLAFVDTFPGEDEILQEASPVMVFGHGEQEDAGDWRDAGGIARIWNFQDSDIVDGISPPHFPATGTPFERWYTDWCETVPTLD